MRLIRLIRLLGRAREQLYTFALRGSFARFGRGSVLLYPARLAGIEHVAIGSGVTVGPHSWIQVIEPHKVRISPAITIGDGVSLAGFATVTAKASVIIEQNVLLARYVYISDHSHLISSRDVPIIRQGSSESRSVRIKEGAWLGQGAVVCPGVTIGANAVVGANSVVRQDVPDYCVAAGIPARIIRHVDGPLSDAERTTYINA